MMVHLHSAKFASFEFLFAKDPLVAAIAQKPVEFIKVSPNFPVAKLNKVYYWLASGSYRRPLMDVADATN